MKKLLPLIGVFAALFLITACKKNVKRPKSTQVVYQETIKEDNKLKVVRKCYYTIDSTKYDTIKRKFISIQTAQRYKNLPDDAVDLNTIFGKYDTETDWNFTELDEEDWEYLNRIGVYWDDDAGCYRKRSTKQAFHSPKR